MMKLIYPLLISIISALSLSIATVAYGDACPNASQLQYQGNGTWTAPGYKSKPNAFVKKPKEDVQITFAEVRWNSKDKNIACRYFLTGGDAMQLYLYSDKSYQNIAKDGSDWGCVSLGDVQCSCYSPKEPSKCAFTERTKVPSLGVVEKPVGSR